MGDLTALGLSPAEEATYCALVGQPPTLDASGNEKARVLPSVPIQLYLADDRLALVLLGGRAGRYP